MSGYPLLAALRYAAFSSSAPNRPPLALRVVACREAIRVEQGMQTGALLATRTRTAGYVGWPRTLHGASAGHSSRTGRNTIDRPRRASCRSPGTKNKASNAPPGHLLPLAWLGDEQPVRVLPWPRPSRPVDTKSMCPLSVLPSPRAPHPS